MYFCYLVGVLINRDIDIMYENILVELGFGKNIGGNRKLFWWFLYCWLFGKEVLWIEWWWVGGRCEVIWWGSMWSDENLCGCYFDFKCGWKGKLVLWLFYGLWKCFGWVWWGGKVCLFLEECFDENKGLF